MTTEPTPAQLLALFGQLLQLAERTDNLTAALDRITAEVAETRGAVQSFIVFAAGIAEQLRQNAHDEAAINALADDLDAGQAEIAAAMIAEPATPADPPADPPVSG